MTTTPQATAAPIAVTLAGQKFRMRPLRDCDFGEFEAWVKRRYIDTARQMAEGLSEADRQTLLNRAFDKAAVLTFSSPDALKLMVTVEGAAKLVWLSLRTEHPDLAEDQVKAWLSDSRTMAEALDRVDYLNGDGKVRVKKKPKAPRK